MVRMLTDGGESAGVQAIWDYIDCKAASCNAPANVLVQGAVDSLLHGSIVPRTGRGMYALDANQILRKDFGSATAWTELYFGFAMNVPSLSTSRFLSVYTDDPSAYSNYMYLQLSAEGRVYLYRTSNTLLAQSAAGVIAADTWHYFEVYAKPRNSGGVFTVKVDGVEVATYSGDTTNEEEYINAWELSGVTASSGAIRPTLFDDIVCNDTTGSTNNSWPGMVRLLPLRARTPGNYGQWDRAGMDLGNDAAQMLAGGFGVHQLQTAVADELVTLVTEVPDLPAGASIQNVIVTARARVESGAGVIAPMVRSNGTNSISSDQTLTTNWKNFEYAWAVNPADSAAWEEADLATLEIGVSS